MMFENSNNRTLKIISDYHNQIANFARESYELDGRGLVQVSFPNVPLCQAAISNRMMRYISLEQLRTVGRREFAAHLIRMVETYEPERQAVVTAAIDEEWPIA